MKTLTKEMIWSGRKDRILVLPRFGLILAICLGATFGYLDIFWNGVEDRRLYLVLGLIAVASTIALILLNKRIKHNMENQKIEILIDKVVDKKMRISLARYVTNSYLLYFEKAGQVRIEGGIKYMRYRRGDSCFLARVGGNGGWLVYNCNKYQLSDELKECVVTNVGVCQMTNN